VILRNALEGCDDAYVVRAGELFFRTQKLALHDGSLVAADEEWVSGLGNKPLSPLVSMLGLPAGAGIDVLSEGNASTYWHRSDSFDMALDLTAGRRGLSALGGVVARWVSHLLAIEVEIEPLLAIEEVDLRWYVGLDREATRVGDCMWRGEPIDDAVRARVIGFFRLRFVDGDDVIEAVRGAPAYLIAAMDADKVLWLKPQNLITGLPIGLREAAG
jgi:hypothetical protein